MLNQMQVLYFFFFTASYGKALGSKLQYLKKSNEQFLRGMVSRKLDF